MGLEMAWFSLAYWLGSVGFAVFPSVPQFVNLQSGNGNDTHNPAGLWMGLVTSRIEREVYRKVIAVATESQLRRVFLS